MLPPPEGETGPESESDPRAGGRGLPGSPVGGLEAGWRVLTTPSSGTCVDPASPSPQKPHDPATVDKVLRVLDEDDTGTVEFKEFLVLVFEVAQACFTTLRDSPEAACGSRASGSGPTGAWRELGEGQRSGPGGVGGAGEGQGSRQASGEQGWADTETQGQAISSPHFSQGDRKSEPQRQERESQQAHTRGHEEPTRRVGENQSHQTRDQGSERQSQTRQQDRAHQTLETGTGDITQTQTGATQTVEQDRGHQTGSTVTQTQESAHGQTRGTETHGHNRSQTSQVVTGGHVHTQGGATQTMETPSHTGAVGQGQSPRQPGSGHGWTQVGDCEGEGTVQGGRAQTGAGAATGGPWERESSGMKQEWVDDPTRETVIPGLGQGSPQRPPAEGTQGARARGLTASELYSYLRSSEP